MNIDCIDCKDGTYKTLLESTKAIPWKMDWAAKKFTYIGPQIEYLLGWKQDDWKTAQDWIDRIHPDYREKIANHCINQSEVGTDHEADYPAITADGHYIWVREVVHVIRKNGVTTELVGFIFDISERKKLEEELILKNKQLEAYSFQDGLTGVANRRMFGRSLFTEWGRAQRNLQPVSVALIDIDYFKQYNDSYGHIQGDICLTQIATALNKVSQRSSDLFARYGGEEFVLLLPDTGHAAALEIAERCRNTVLKLKIPHESSSVSDVITVSVGVSTLIPTADTEPAAIIEAADRMLYQAKRKSRNCVECC
ncbi:MAG: sensor domain-containing diguanylate cyclase [Gammaproteobacteria bacterium]|nr:sensor domain-containing diguanylate cyclase [Gammaproteobacteria bacterium]